MRGIVSQVGKRHAIVFDSEGRFHRTNSEKGLRVGCEMDFNPETGSDRLSGKRPRIAAIAAACVFVLGLGTCSYCIPYGYVNVDINPSVEITYNIYERILSVKALNDDGSVIIGNDAYFNEPIVKGIDKIINNAIKKGYIVENIDENTVVLSVSSINPGEAGKLKNVLKVKAVDELVENEIHASIYFGAASNQRRIEAEQEGITPGKLLLIYKLIEWNPASTVEAYKDKPIIEIMSAIKKIRKDSKDSKDKGAGNDNNDGDNSNGGNDNNGNANNGNDNNGNNSNGSSSNGSSSNGSSSSNSKGIEDIGDDNYNADNGNKGGKNGNGGNGGKN